MQQRCLSHCGMFTIVDVAANIHKQQFGIWSQMSSCARTTEILIVKSVKFARFYFAFGNTVLRLLLWRLVRYWSLRCLYKQLAVIKVGRYGGVVLLQASVLCAQTLEVAPSAGLCQHISLSYYQADAVYNITTCFHMICVGCSRSEKEDYES